MMSFTCPCGGKNNIQFDHGETSRKIPCTSCYGEEMRYVVTRVLEEGENRLVWGRTERKKHGKILLVGVDGSCTVVQSFDHTNSLEIVDGNEDKAPKNASAVDALAW